MKHNKKTQLSIFFLISFVLSGTTLSYAEVATLTTDNSFYVKGKPIKFSGTVEENSKGLVTIVVTDPNKNFVC